MLMPGLCSRENVERAKYAQIGVAVIAVAVCGYLAITTVGTMRQACRARALLRAERMEAARLSRTASRMRQEAEREPAYSRGGLDLFAVRLAQWAAACGVRIESVAPEGAPVPNQIRVNEADLGTWNANNVRVQGRGRFAALQELLGRFGDPRFPVQLESFRLQSGVSGGEVNFDIKMTVYEKKRGAG